jgi:phosphoribosylformylglycinamidine synthase
MGNTVLAQPEDAGLIRLDESTARGIALSTDGNGRYTRLDPYAGAQLALAEAYRNVATTGARPLAVTNCLNFGSPEDPAVMWQFTEAVRGLADGCLRLGVPVTGGNVSFYNQTGSTPILPTPVIGVLGVIEDVAKRVPSGFLAAGHDLVLLGETADELDGSAWAWVEHDHLGGRPPAVRLEAEKAIAELLVHCCTESLLTTAHDLAEGGLSQTLVEASLLNNVGASVSITGDPFVALFSESSARVLIATTQREAFLAAAANCGVPARAIGVTGGGSLVVDGSIDVSLDELRAASEGTLPALFG